MSDVTEQITFARVDIDKSTTTGRLHFELDKLKRGVGPHRQSEGGKTIACTAKESSTNMVHYNIISAPGHKDFIMNMTTGTSQAGAAIIEMPDDVYFAIATAFNIARQKEERQRDMIIAYNTPDMPVNSERELKKPKCKGNSGTAFEIEHSHAGHGQERYDETSSDLKNVLIASNKKEFSVDSWSSITSGVPGHKTLQHSRTVSDFVVRCPNRVWTTQDFLSCSNLPFLGSPGLEFAPRRR